VWIIFPFPGPFRLSPARCFFVSPTSAFPYNFSLKNGSSGRLDITFWGLIMCQLETEGIVSRIDPAKESRSLPGWRSK
jgi:hypothetical protein